MELQTVEQAIHGFVRWVEAIPGKPVFIAYPAGFDFTFVYWYMMSFVGRSPFSFSALDIKSYAMAKLGKRYCEIHKGNLPQGWLPEDKHTHVAVDDAVEQGKLFMAMRGWESERPASK
jgi:hypothetical protein